MEKPEKIKDERTMMQRATVEELVALKDFTGSPVYVLLRDMFLERLEAAKMFAFDLDPSGPDYEKALKHYGKRKEIEYQADFLSNLFKTCSEELEKRAKINLTAKR